MTTAFAATRLRDGCMQGVRYVDFKITLPNPVTNPAAPDTIDMSTYANGGFSTIYSVDAQTHPYATGAAYLLGGTAATSTVATWNAVNDGYLKANIDGAGVVEYGPCDFSGVGITTMALVAGVIQTAIRAVTGSTETVTWSATAGRFTFTSASTDPWVSSFSLLTAGTSGTDISGAGATAFCDSDAAGTAVAVHSSAIGFRLDISHAGTTTLTLKPVYGDLDAVSDGAAIVVPSGATVTDNTYTFIRVWGN